MTDPPHPPLSNMSYDATILPSHHQKVYYGQLSIAKFLSKLRLTDGNCKM